MKFTDFEVRAVGTTVVLSCLVDGDSPSGAKLDLAVEVGSDALPIYEELFRRLAALGNCYAETADDVLEATSILMKGKP